MVKVSYRGCSHGQSSPSDPLLKFISEYAQVLRLLGDGRAALQCFDNQARTGLIRGTMRRRVWISTVSLPG